MTGSANPVGVQSSIAWLVSLGSVYGTNQQTITEHASLLRFDLSFNFGSSWKDQLNPCFGKNMKNTDNRAAVKRS